MIAALEEWADHGERAQLWTGNGKGSTGFFRENHAVDRVNHAVMTVKSSQKVPPVGARHSPSLGGNDDATSSGRGCLLSTKSPFRVPRTCHTIVT